MAAYLLAQTELRGLGERTVASLRLLSDRLPQGSAVWADAHLCLIWHLPLWCRAPEAFQRALLRTLVEWVAAEPERYRRLVGVQRLLDLLRCCYWGGAADTLVVPHEQAVPASVLPRAPHDAGRAREARANRRPGASARCRIRRQVLDVVGAMVGDAATLPEARMLVSFVVECPDDCSVADVLALLLRLLCKGSSLVEHVAKLGGAVVFIPIFRRGHVRVDAVGVQLLGALARLSAGSADRKDLLGRKTDVRGLFLCVASMLVDRPLAEPVFDAMVQVLVLRLEPERFACDSVGSLLSPSALLSRSQTRTQLLHAKFQIPSMLQCILRVASAGDDGLRRRIILDLTPAIANDDFHALLSHPGWQQSLFDVVSSPLSDGNPREPKLLTMTLKSVANLFRKALLWCLRHRRDGHAVWEETLSYATVAAAEGAAHISDLRGELYRLVLEGARRLVEGATARYSDDADMWGNVGYLLCREDWRALSRSVAEGEPGVFGSTEPPPPLLGTLSQLVCATVLKFGPKLRVLDHPLIPKASQSYFAMLFHLGLELYAETFDSRLLPCIESLLQAEKKCMTRQRLLLGVTTLLSYLQFDPEVRIETAAEMVVNRFSVAAPVGLETEQNLRIASIVWDAFKRRWDDFVDENGKRLLGEQNSMMPPMYEPVRAFTDVVFGASWRTALSKIKEAAAAQPEHRAAPASGVDLLELGRQAQKRGAREESTAARMAARTREAEARLGRDELNRVTAELPRLYARANAQVRQTASAGP
jgi:hypothetical protein